MTSIGYFKKRQEEAEKELAKLSEELDNLNQDLAKIQEEINNAIDNENLSLVEKLTLKESEIKNRIHAKELIIARKIEKGDGIAPDIIKANNDAMDDCQKRIDKAQEAISDAYRDYLGKVLDAAKLVIQAWKIRADYVSLLPEVEDPYTINHQNTDFRYVSHKIKTYFTEDDYKIMKSINPDAVNILSDLTRNREKRVYRDDPPSFNVIISKKE